MSTLDEVLPLLGLVLFGDPQVAKRFYRDNFAVAMERHHGNAKKAGRDATLAKISEGTVKGFFPAIEPGRRRR